MLNKLLAALRTLFGSKQGTKETSAVVLETWIGVDRFREATGLREEEALRWYPHVRHACLKYQITGPTRIAAYLAQVGHESAGFQYTREIWGPTPAQQGYEGRKDLGNIHKGDGSKFRGRGLIQITGRYNYEKASKALKADFINNPQKLEDKDMAALSSAWWWAEHGCNELADAGDFDKLTRRINGGLNGIADRRERWSRAIKALSV